MSVVWLGGKASRTALYRVALSMKLWLPLTAQKKNKCVKIECMAGEVARLVDLCLTCTRSEPSVAVYTCHPSTWEVEATGSEIQGYPQLHTGIA